MARPEFITDIEAKPVDFGHIEVDKLTLHPALLKGYTAFIEAAQKSGAVVTDSNYGRVSFSRPPTLTELQSQLQSAQERWDEGEKYYNQIAAVGETEYPYQRNMAESWATAEELPFPPACEPISDFHKVINGIDEVIG